MKHHLSLFASVLVLAACSSTTTSAPVEPVSPLPVAQDAPKLVTESETEKLNAFFQTVFDEDVARSPMTQTSLGIKDNYDKWDDPSAERAKEDFDILTSRVEQMNAEFDYDALEPSAQLSFDLFNYSYELSKLRYEWREYGYIFNQMGGQHSRIPAFLINQHRIWDLSDAEAYISRLYGIEDYLSVYIDRAKVAADKGIRPPFFVYEYVLDASKNVLTGYPFGETADMTDSPLMDDFRGKVKRLLDEDKIDATMHDVLLAEAEQALIEAVGPTYLELIDFIEEDRLNATMDDGAWKHPRGDEYYNARLQIMTTTDMTASEIHDLGLAEMDRIHGEMRQIMKQVGFEGTLQDFFEYTRTDDKFFKPNTPEGKAEYLAEATAFIDGMRDALPTMFNTFPEAELIVKAVEPFREKSAGKAFYQRPAADGSRPGTYYANLYDTKQMPLYQMEALAYHEGLPGHHMQLAIMQELEGIPDFRKFGGYTPYIEGWGLYTEYFPKEFGFYEDPYSDFGRLAMELWRAARLVVDTGLHEKKWSREKATQYLITNTPNPAGDAVKAIDRYIVMPGQATAYKIGMIKILELRAMAEEELGDAYDIREFHDAVLRNGAVPLAILEELVKEYVEETKSTQAS